MKKLFCCPTLEFLLSTPMENSNAVQLQSFLVAIEKNEATWKKATKCNKVMSLKAELQENYDSKYHEMPFKHQPSLFTTSNMDRQYSNKSQ